MVAILALEVSQPHHTNKDELPTGIYKICPAMDGADETQP